ncbi:MAG: ankyrin repeat domain-containing protein [Treponemataceae bacterium]|nr:ankyrin repeat domain-containing protein [Treponemataceae bacterium]
MRRRGICVLCLLVLTLIGCTSMPDGNPDRKTEFRQAIEQKNMKKLAKLIEKSTPDEKRDGLFLAIGHLNDINVLPYAPYVTPTEVVEMVRLFLEGGVDVNSVRYGYGYTPLLRVCQLSRAGYGTDEKYDIVKLLLETGADVNAVDGEGRSALWHAVEEGRTDIVRLLIQYGADVNVQYKGRTLLYSAQVSNKNTEIADLLRDAGAKPGEKEELAIQKAIEAEKLRKQKEAEIAKLKENLKRGSNNFYNEVIYHTGTPIKTGDEFLIDKNRIEVLDRTTSQAGYTYLVTYYSTAYERSRDYANSFSGGGAKYCFCIVSKKEMALHKTYSYTTDASYITSVNDLKLTCTGISQYQHNYQDVDCYVFTLDAEL